jgi:hypothetical protein
MNSEPRFFTANKKHFSCAFTFLEEPCHLPLPSSSNIASPCEC